MYEHIVVALDCTPVDETSLEHVARLATIHGSHVLLVRAAHYHTLDSKAHEVEDARECLKGCATRLKEQGVDVDTVMARGEPAEAIVQQAEDLHAELIVMCTHGHSFLERWLLGSVADQVRHSTSIPLLLLKSGHRAATGED